MTVVIASTVKFCSSDLNAVAASTFLHGSKESSLANLNMLATGGLYVYSGLPHTGVYLEGVLFASVPVEHHDISPDVDKVSECVLIHGQGNLLDTLGLSSVSLDTKRCLPSTIHITDM